MNIYAPHLGTALIVLISVVALYLGRKFLGDALSEKGGGPSSRRLIAFTVISCICICEIFHTLKQEKFDFQHLVFLGLIALMYSGLTNMDQIVALKNGSSITKSTTSIVSVEQQKEEIT